jgi:hypothetical protein
LHGFVDVPYSEFDVVTSEDCQDCIAHRSEGASPVRSASDRVPASSVWLLPRRLDRETLVDVRDLRV